MSCIHLLEVLGVQQVYFLVARCRVNSTAQQPCKTGKMHGVHRRKYGVGAIREWEVQKDLTVIHRSLVGLVPKDRGAVKITETRAQIVACPRSSLDR